MTTARRPRGDVGQLSFGDRVIHLGKGATRTPGRLGEGEHDQILRPPEISVTVPVR